MDYPVRYVDQDIRSLQALCQSPSTRPTEMPTTGPCCREAAGVSFHWGRVSGVADVY
nr:hypothetical protein [Mariniblastus sp.]